MRVAVMQPYLFPYLGYFHLLRAVDVLVSLDDVQYVKRRWMNRNRVVVGGSVRWLSVPVRHAPQRTAIRDVTYDLAHPEVTSLAGSLLASYAKAPGWTSVEHLWKVLTASPDERVSVVNEHLLTETLDLLGETGPRLVRASDLGCPHEDPQLRIVGLCEALGAATYVNPAGGRELYDPAVFAARGLELRFVRSTLRPYPQGLGAFEPGLSVLDVLARCGAGAGELSGPQCFELVE